MGTVFEWDLNKEKSNLQKHRINLKDASRVWDDQSSIVMIAKTLDEKRYMIIGKILNKYWSVIFTYRENRTRIICARRSRQSEVRTYEKNN